MTSRNKAVWDGIPAPVKLVAACASRLGMPQPRDLGAAADPSEPEADPARAERDRARNQARLGIGKPAQQLRFPDGMRASPAASLQDQERPAARTVLKYVNVLEKQFERNDLTEMAQAAAEHANHVLAKPDPNHEVRLFDDHPEDVRGNFEKSTAPGADPEDRQTWLEFRILQPVDPADPDGEREARRHRPPHAERLAQALRRGEDFNP
jgi:hypothetical protein